MERRIPINYITDEFSKRKAVALPAFDSHELLTQQDLLLFRDMKNPLTGATLLFNVDHPFTKYQNDLPELADIKRQLPKSMVDDELVMRRFGSRVALLQISNGLNNISSSIYHYLDGVFAPQGTYASMRAKLDDISVKVRREFLGPMKIRFANPNSHYQRNISFEEFFTQDDLSTMQIFNFMAAPYWIAPVKTRKMFIDQTVNESQTYQGETLTAQDYGEMLHIFELLEDTRQKPNGFDPATQGFIEARDQYLKARDKVRKQFMNPSDQDSAEEHDNLMKSIRSHLFSGMEERVLDILGLTEPDTFTQTYSDLTRRAKTAKKHKATYEKVLRIAAEYAQQHDYLKTAVETTVEEAEPIHYALLSKPSFIIEPLVVLKENTDSPEESTIVMPLETGLGPKGLNIPKTLLPRIKRIIKRFNEIDEGKDLATLPATTYNNIKHLNVNGYQIVISRVDNENITFYVITGVKAPISHK